MLTRPLAFLAAMCFCDVATLAFLSLLLLVYLSQRASDGTVHEGNDAGFPEPAGGASDWRDRVHDPSQEGCDEHRVPSVLRGEQYFEDAHEACSCRWRTSAVVRMHKDCCFARIAR